MSTPIPTEDSQQSLEQAGPRQIKFTLWQRITNKGGSFLFISIVFHAILLLIAAAYVVQTIQQKDKLKFSGAPKSAGSPGQKSLEYKVQTAKRNQSMSTPVSATRLTSSASNAKVAIPEVAMSTSSAFAMPSTMGGMSGGAFSGGGGGGMGGTGMPGGMGGMGMSNVKFTAFGFSGNAPMRGLVGTFYDLKQTPDKKPTELDQNSPGPTYEFLNSFASANFNTEMLKPYFKSPVNLMAHRFWIPQMEGFEVPKAFEVDKEVRPRSILVHYKGRIVCPKDGKYKWIAYGADYIGIKVNGKVVLPFKTDPKKGRIYCEKRNALYEKFKGGHAVSEEVLLRKNQEFDMEVVLAVGASGLVGFSLLVENDEDIKNRKYKVSKEGLQIPPMFEMEVTTPIPDYPETDRTPSLLPPRHQDRLLWKVIRETAAK